MEEKPVKGYVRTWGSPRPGHPRKTSVKRKSNNSWTHSGESAQGFVGTTTNAAESLDRNAEAETEHYSYDRSMRSGALATANWAESVKTPFFLAREAAGKVTEQGSPATRAT